MKKFRKELLILALQIFLYYIFPLFAGPTDAMGMVFVIIVGTFALGYFFALASRWKWMWCWPAVVSVLFAPTVLIYYNSSAWVHVLWYLVLSAAGMLFGLLIRKLFQLK